MPFDNGRPGPTEFPPGFVLGTLRAVACATVCIAVGANYSLNPNVANMGTVLPITNGSIGSEIDVPGTLGLNGIECRRIGSCLAVGTGTSGGAEVAITSGSPGSPTAVSGTTSLNAVACATRRKCLAVGYTNANGATEGVVVTIPHATSL